MTRCVGSVACSIIPAGSKGDRAFTKTGEDLLQLADAHQDYNGRAGFRSQGDVF